MSSDYREEVLAKIKERENAMATESGDSTFLGKFCAFTQDNSVPGNLEITYAIIAKWGKRTYLGALPFFSKLTLRSCVEDLRRMGYKISVACINIV
jgi:uncharacterized protein (TIGR04141 family)